jgi:hypothetical protein
MKDSKSHIVYEPNVKFLFIDSTFFLLPNGFEGTVADGLRLFADYLETRTKADITKQGVSINRKQMHNDYLIDSWMKFVKATDEGYKSFHGIAVQEYDGEAFNIINSRVEEHKRRQENDIDKKCKDD